MLALIAILAFNFLPLQDIQLDTEQGKATFGQKLNICTEQLAQEWSDVRAKETALKETTARFKELTEELDQGSTDTSAMEANLAEERAALKTLTGHLAQEWNEDLAKEAALKEIILQEKASSLNALTEKVAERESMAKKCDELASLWQLAAKRAAPLIAKVQAGLKAFQDTDKTIGLLEAYQAGQELSEADLAFLEQVSLICETP
jgi:hypothetical protein